jgi:large subunit ribosomal protein L35
LATAIAGKGLLQPTFCAIRRALNRPACQGCRGGFFARSQPSTGSAGMLRRGHRIIESQMPKLKTKSGAKKRFKVTGTGKVLYTQAGKRHGMIKRTNKQIRNLRGTSVLFKSDGDNIKKYFLPNG